jgi:LuxR family maltose regulon positive regulatory protein
MRVLRPEKFFFSERLSNALISVFHFPMTILSAPMGYGKRIAASSYLLSTNAAILWMNLNKDADEAYFWEEFCKIFAEYQATNQNPFTQDSFPSGVEKNDEVVRELRAAISKFDGRECVLVLSDLQEIHIRARTRIIHFLKYIASAYINHFHIVLITSSKPGIEAYDRIDNSIFIIGTELFRLGKAEITRLFQNYGMTLDGHEQAKIEQFSEGWLSAISALVIVSLEFGGLDDQTLAETSCRMAAYMRDSIYDDLPEPEKQLIAVMHGFDCFSIEQADFICKYAGFAFEAKEAVRALTDSNFFIDYNYLTYQYRFHKLLRAVGETEFRKFDRVRREKVLNASKIWKTEQKKILACGGFIPAGNLSKRNSAAKLNVKNDGGLFCFGNNHPPNHPFSGERVIVYRFYLGYIDNIPGM